MCSSTNGRRCWFVIVAFALCGCFAALLPSAANGDLIDPVHNLLPDINTGYVSAEYNAGTGQLNVYGYAAHYGDANGPDIDDGWFTLSAKLTQSAATPMNVSGDLSITGSVEGGPSGTLLTATVDRVGSQLVADQQYAIFDFAFHVTGGALASDFGATGGTTVLVHYEGSDGDVAFTGSFGDSFQYGSPPYGDGVNTADTYSTVPEPGSAALMLMSIITGLAASVLRRSWTRRN